MSDRRGFLKALPAFVALPFVPEEKSKPLPTIVVRVVGAEGVEVRNNAIGQSGAMSISYSTEV